ncbi:peptidyl-prolyl cis-trans isomerase FKBP16-3, chloroplastic-like [Punica granatum]|uniref:peptidylprolyl isomerase n=1 Tax=Punica granatum TaxID=22663 RepID=A0A6P8BWR0_PUNGR|nr:peptidyl-prolyl cis-trans isomerase FKBP16-3, chloroplastic-like [Punica granatum]
MIELPYGLWELIHNAVFVGRKMRVVITYSSQKTVAANYVAMIPNGQIFDSSLGKGQPYIFRVGSGQVIKELDEGILTMKTGGKRRLYIRGSLAFPKGLTSAPGRPRVAPNSPVVFDVSLEYIPGLELDEE